MLCLLAAVLLCSVLALPTSNDASSITSVSIAAPTPGKPSCKGSPQGTVAVLHAGVVNRTTCQV